MLEELDGLGMGVVERCAGGSDPPFGLNGPEFRLKLLLGTLPLGSLGVFLDTLPIGER